MPISQELRVDISTIKIRAILPCEARPRTQKGYNTVCVELREELGESRPNQYQPEDLKPIIDKQFAEICLGCSLFAQAVAALPPNLK